MIRSYSLFTCEVDDVDVALADINTQLSELTLLKNTVGIVVCHYDYVNNGIVEALNDSLSFPITGFTTFYQKSDKTQGLFEMTITILTSDDVKFVLSENFSEKPDPSPNEIIKKTYMDAYEVYNEKPACIFNFISVNRPVSGDEYVRLIDEFSGEVPCFGGIATSDNDMGQNMFVISNGHIFSTGFAILLIIGDVTPKFTYINYDESQFMDMSAEVTKSEGESIVELNNHPAIDFLEESGITVDENNKSGLLTIPFLFKRGAKSPYISRIAYDIDERGALKMFGEVPEGSKFRIGTAGPDDIIRLSEKALKDAFEEAPDAKACFIFSCIGRYIALGMRQGSEFENIDGIIPPNFPYVASYVGGEICPAIDDNKQKNKFHNSSIVICTL